ncbi:MAG: carbohydrate ABC transporter permease [Chloroflexi bacterium]|jgi:ABC-type glycerol-3-phosphate transport system permease component|nr:carbohydrate ABC transporter permease [Chloroflexota bacterium]
MANQDVLTQHIGTIKKTNPVARVIGKIFIYFVLIVGAIVSLFPFFWMLSQSLMTLGETLQIRWLPSVPQWHNYAEAWSRAKFGDYFLNSTWVTLGTIIGVLITSILAAYAFARIQFPGRNLIFTLFLATMMVPESVTLIPNLFMIRGNIIPWGNWNDTFWVLTVPFMANAFSVFLLRQFFQQVPNELWDAARIDGAGHMRFLTQIVLPISTAPIVTVILFAFTGAWNAFSWPLIVSGRKWRTLMVGLYNFVSEAGTETQLLMAGAVISLIPILILYIFTQKQFTQGIATTGLKG